MSQTHSRLVRTISLVRGRLLSAPDRLAPVDVLVLTLISVLPQTPFLSRLGFYADDWLFLSTFAASPGRSPLALFETVFSAQPWARVRPVQLGYLSTLFWMFGEQPLGYHVFNLAVFTAGVVVFYLALRELKQPRTLCLALPIVYAVLPHYSTGRFWIAASQANVSMFGLFLNLYAALRMLRSRHPAVRLLWGGLSVLALLLSGLAYEVALPLFLLNGVLIWQRSNQRRAALVLVVTLLVALGAVIGVKFLFSDRAALDSGWLLRAARIAYGSTRVNLVEYGLFLPFVLWTIVRDYASAVAFAMATAVALLVLGWFSVEEDGPDSRRLRSYWFQLFAAGGVAYALGYAVFLGTDDMAFSTTGPVNRTAIAAAVGMAMMLVAGAGLVKRGRFFAPLIAVICFCGILIDETVAAMWTAASAQQMQVLARVRASLPALTAGTTVLLDGLCPNIGPAPVFESACDFGAALGLAYRDPSIAGDVLSPTTEADSASVSNIIYGETNRHFYSDRLIALDYRSGVAVPPACSYSLPPVSAASE